MNNVNEKPRPTSARPTFTRFAFLPNAIASYVREAKRVGYAVQTVRMGSVTVCSHEVTDPTHGHDLVFRAVQLRPGRWAVTFSTAYFSEAE